MKKSICYAFIFICMFFLSCKENAVPEAKVIGGGHLYVKGNYQSFGEVHKTEKEVKCTYELKNIGDKPVVVHKIDVSCGCLSVEISSDKIMPNKVAILTIHINPERQLGYFNKSIYVNSNAVNSVLLLRVKGFIVD